MSEQMDELLIENQRLSEALAYQLKAAKAMRDAGDDLARYVYCTPGDVHPYKLPIMKKWKAVRLPTEGEYYNDFND